MKKQRPGALSAFWCILQGAFQWSVDPVLARFGETWADFFRCCVYPTLRIDLCGFNACLHMHYSCTSSYNGMRGVCQMPRMEKRTGGRKQAQCTAWFPLYLQSLRFQAL
ncbi:hypothetical protein DL89DRAFT_173033 [Linderina pennispora]|uniref:Secreted protein n=1 Tax=Linderina pennispora TaxID=61395 RepID=A0A1Y1W7Q4_9FUNG|nr:uncharacterized protein DL89DRAFT_173033 [Linderina pennispora]ORX69204.1 hypothetical protein DL89DRAFT_173033 [Linderina pennispora]